MPEPSASEFEMATEKLKITGIYQIPAKLIKAGDRTIRFEVDVLVNFICNKKEL